MYDIQYACKSPTVSPRLSTFIEELVKGMTKVCDAALRACQTHGDIKSIDLDVVKNGLEEKDRKEQDCYAKTGELHSFTTGLRATEQFNGLIEDCFAMTVYFLLIFGSFFKFVKYSLHNNLCLSNLQCNDGQCSQCNIEPVPDHQFL